MGGPVEGTVGRGTTNPMVAIAVEKVENGERKYLGRIRMEVVEDGTQPSLLTFVRGNVTVGSEVVTDGTPRRLRAPREDHRPRPQVRLQQAPWRSPHRLAGQAGLLGTHQGSGRRQSSPGAPTIGAPGNAKAPSWRSSRDKENGLVRTICSASRWDSFHRCGLTACLLNRKVNSSR